MTGTATSPVTRSCANCRPNRCRGALERRGIALRRRRICRFVAGNGEPRCANLAERIRTAVSATPIELDASNALTVTVSIGIASLGPVPLASDLNRLGEGLIAAADVALYQAKADGRNCVRAAA